MGALGSLDDLRLQENRIGDEGMKAFSSAIATGALPKHATVYVGGNPHESGEQGRSEGSMQRTRNPMLCVRAQVYMCVCRASINI